MKFRAIILLLCLILALSVLVSCNQTPGNTDGTGDTGGENTGGESTGGNGTDTDADGGETESDRIVLTEGGKASFRFVTTSAAGSSAIKSIERAIRLMRNAGIEVKDRVGDSKQADVSEYEIIVGTDVRFREGAAVSRVDVGPRGYVIKAVGNKIVIAGGTAELTDRALGIFLDTYLGIDGISADSTVSVEKTLYECLNTEYTVGKITLGGKDLSEYVLMLDVDGARDFTLDSIYDFSDMLFDSAGYLLEQIDPINADEVENKIIIRHNPSMQRYADAGFAAYFEGESFVIECGYANAFGESFAHFAESEIFSRAGGAEINKDYVYTDVVSRVSYSDFGAVGDGVTDDYDAIRAAHVYANQCGQTVYADAGKSYYVHVFHSGSIPVKTNVCLGDAKIIIDDRGSEVYAQRGTALYTLVRDYSDYNTEGAESMLGRFGEVSLSVGQTTIPWLAEALVADSLVTFINANHKDFVRNGGNRDSGYSRQDHVLVDADGNVDPTTPIIFEFTEITSVRISRVDDTPITFEGGYFESICCTVVEDTDFVNKYHSYARGLMIYRANSTVTGVTHRMVGEPEYDPSIEKYGRGGDGKLSQSYPYHAFILVKRTANVELTDMDLTGHATYYEDKTTSSNPVPMGSYDFVLEGSIDVRFLRVVQNGVDYRDSKYWGIMASNGVKNLYFEDCTISRYDAHRGFWNGTLINVKLGHSFNVIGGGLLYANGVEKAVGNTFISLRGDYGATFEGDVELVNCELKGCSTFNSRNGGSFSDKVSSSSGVIISSGYSTSSSYLNWDFGFTCYMPRNVVLDNFKSGIGSVYVYNNIKDAAFGTDISNTYVITESITFRNMSPLTICSSSSCTKLRGIRTVSES